jgi:exodeoxyribonuclease-3
VKLTTWNVNGVRARVAELLAWIERERPDVLCMQEIKAAPEQLPEALCKLEDYHCYWHGQKGYSGVGLLLHKQRFAEPPTFAHPSFDHESRIVTARVELGSRAEPRASTQLEFSSIYVPNGGKDLAAKVRFLDALDAYAAEAQTTGRQLLLCGDLNVAREPRDVHPSLHKKNEIGQTPEERAQLERIISRGLVDLSRKFEPDNDRLFSWWAPWRNLRERNIGWRIDYLLVSSALAGRAKSCVIEREFGKSDHAPVTAVFEL